MSNIRIGCALPMSLFESLENPVQCSDPITTALLSAFGNQNQLFEEIAHTASSVELRSVFTSALPQTVLFAAELCKSNNMAVTIHGAFNSKNSDCFFRPYYLLFESGLQDVYTINLHALWDIEGTKRMLDFLLCTIEREKFPVKIVLENNRIGNTRHCGDSIEEVCEIVRNFNSKHLSACWDMGHTYADILHHNVRFIDNMSDSHNPLIPSIRDLKQVGHTHIHAIGNNTTHYPLNHGELPLADYLSSLLQVDYDGILNLELEFDRFMSEYPIKDSLLESLHILKSTLISLMEFKSV